MFSFYDVYYGIGALPSNKTIINYFGSNNVSKQFTYKYRHGNIPYREIETGSSGEELIKEIKIINDYVYSNSNPDAIIFRELKDDNILVPIENLTYYKKDNEEKLIGASTHFYKKFNGLNLISQEFEFETNKPINDYNSLDLNGSNTIQDTRMKSTTIFDEYDSKGNLLEFYKKGGPRIINVWGYNDSKLIAQLKNASYSNLTSLQTSAISDAQNSSNIDTTASTENTLRAKLNILSGRFNDVQTATFTYNPLVNVTSITDASKYTSHFNFDELNRLQYISNADKRVLEEYKYNFKLDDIIANTSTSVASVTSGQSVTFTTNASGGTGDFTYKWVVTNANLNQVYNTTTGSLTITTTNNHAPNFTVTCEVTDVQIDESVTTSTQVNVTLSYPALSASNLYSNPYFGSKFVGQSISYSISISGGSGNYSYSWKKSNNQGSTNYSVNGPSLNNIIITLSDCASFTMKCAVTDLVTGEVIFKSNKITITSGCLGGEEE